MADTDSRPAPPWKKKSPKAASGKKKTTLSPAKKQQAKSRARAAGRPYPNLVDNMAVARGVKKKKAAARKASRKTSKKR